MTTCSLPFWVKWQAMPSGVSSSRSTMAPGVDGDPPFFQDHGKVLGDLPVHGGQDAVHGLHNGHLASKALVHRGELHPDDPAADDDQVLVQLILQKEELIAGAHMGQVQAGDGGPGGLGAGGHQDIFAGQFHRALPVATVTL